MFDDYLDKFIEGENVNLCIPTTEFALSSEWVRWVNSKENTKFLSGRGEWPQNQQDQLEFFTAERKKRLLLIIEFKSKYIGVCSLSNIDYYNQKADMALIIDSKDTRLRSG